MVGPMERLGKSTKFKFEIGSPVYGSVFSLAFFTIEESLQETNRWPNGLRTLSTRLYLLKNYAISYNKDRLEGRRIPINTNPSGVLTRQLH